MNDRIILPFDTKPLYLTYGDLGFPAGIMTAHNNRANDWVLSNCLDLFWDNKFGVYNRNVSFFKEAPILTDYYEIYGCDIIRKPNEVIREFVSLIEKGYYIHSYFNEIAIPDKWAYQSFDYKHDYYMLGFDNISKYMLIFGYVKNGSCIPYTVSYEDFISSLVKYEENRISVELLSPNFNYEYSYSWNNVKNSIELFLRSENYINVFDTTREHGVEAQRQYIKYLHNKKNDDCEIDLRNTRLLMENKRVLLQAVKKGGVVSQDLQNELSNLYCTYDAQHMLAIKYNLTRNKRVLDKMIELLELTLENEIRLLRLIAYT